MLEAIVLPFPSIQEAYTTEKDTDGFMQFELVDDGTYRLDCYDFYDAFNLLFSDEMVKFIKLANIRNEREIEYRNSYNQVSHVMRDGNSITEETLYDVTSKARSYGILAGQCEEMRNAIINRVSWNTWINAARLYETFTGTYREWLT